MCARTEPAIAALEPVPDPVWLAPPQLPPWPVVWLALDGGHGGGPAGHAVRLWGLALDDGRGEPRLEAITSEIADPGGTRAWRRFVARAGELLERNPEARWVHCSPDERDRVLAHAARHGAPPGFRARLEEALFELLSRGVRRAVRLPHGSDTIRQVAGPAGFRWRNAPPEAGEPATRHREPEAGADAVAEAIIRRGLADSNAEVLRAMRAVWRWMLEQGPREYCG